MPLFDKLRKPPAVSDADVKQIRERVRSMRDQIGRRDVELADLFALIKEDERPVLREIREVRRPEIARVWPDQVPSQPKPAVEANLPETTYGDWELLRRRSFSTAP